MNCDHFTIRKFRVYTIHSMIHQCKILGLIIQNVFLENLHSHFEWSFKTFTVVNIWCEQPPVEIWIKSHLILLSYRWIKILIFVIYTIHSMIHQWSILGLIIFNYFSSYLKCTFKTFTEAQIRCLLPPVEDSNKCYSILMNCDHFYYSQI